MNRYKDWLEQAKSDLGHAERSIEMGDYAWACFAAQQAAEKSVKALHMRLGQVVWGHSVFYLLEALPEGAKPNEGFLDKGKILDKFYIPPRYPNAHPAGPAYRHYTKSEAQEGVRLAKEVLDYCERKGLEDRS